MKKAKLITIVVLAVLVAIIVLQNVDPVPIKLLFFPPISMPIAVLIAITWLIGLICGILIPMLKKKK